MTNEEGFYTVIGLLEQIRDVLSLAPASPAEPEPSKLSDVELLEKIRSAQQQIIRKLADERDAARAEVERLKELGRKVSGCFGDHDGSAPVCHLCRAVREFKDAVAPAPADGGKG